MTPNLLDSNEEDQLHVDETKNYLEELVGEDKKFKTPEDLAKGKAISDNYISVLEKRLDAAREEMKTLRDQNIAGPKLQELIDKYDSLEKQLTTRQNTPKSNEDNMAPYDPKQVESLIDSRMTQRETARKEQENYNSVMDKLTERYGDNFKNALKKQATELGLTDEDVNSMARRNPNLFIKTFDLTAHKNDNFSAPPRSNMRNDNFSPRAPEKRLWSYYEGLRKKDPLAWMDKKIAVQMEADSQKYGKDFYDI